MAILPELLVSAAVLQNFLIGKDGLPLAAGVVTLYHDNDRQLLKNWYYQSGTPGNYTWIPLPNPMTLSAAGTIQDANGNDVDPFYYPWFLDPSTGNVIYDPYYVTVYNYRGEFQFTRAFFPFNGDEVNPNPPTQDIFTLDNLIINNRFWRNIGSINASTLVPNPTSGTSFSQTGNFGLSYNSSGNFYYATLAPSQNDGFSMPDFNYIKNAQGGSETISFLSFPPSTEPVINGDVMPEFYIEHICGTQDTGVSIKVYQFPIALHLDNLAGQKASVSIQARSNTGGTPLTLSLYQFQGTGNTSVQGIPFAVFPLTTSWKKWNSVTFTFPSNLSVVPSSTGDDAWYLQIGMPVTPGPFEIDFTLPSLYLNPASDIPTNSFQSYDDIDTTISKPRTGDVRISLNNLYPYGWLPMNEGTIGNDSSNATLRPNIDSWPLYNILWNNFNLYSSNGNPLIPIYDSLGAPTIYGASSLTDWTLNKAIALTKSMGQVLLGTVPTTALLPSTTTFTGYSSVVTATNSSGVLWTTSPSGNLLNLFQGNTVIFSSSTALINVTANVVYYIVPASTTTFHIATSFQNALSGTFVGFTGAETGVVTAYLQLSGSYEGEYAHSQLTNEVGSHGHTGSTFPNSIFTGTNAAGGATQLLGRPGAGVPITIANNSPAGSPANVTQPGTFNNMYIKL